MDGQIDGTDVCARPLHNYGAPFVSKFIIGLSRQFLSYPIFVLGQNTSQNLSGRTFFGSHILSYSAKTCPRQSFSLHLQATDRNV